MRVPEWHGTPEERQSLLMAIAHNCACERTGPGTAVKLCASHRMLLEDQRVLDLLACGRRMAERFQREEMTGPRPGTADQGC